MLGKGQRSGVSSGASSDPTPMSDRGLSEQLPEEDDEYQQIRHLLLACLVGKGEVGRVDVHKINNQQMTLKYERKSKGLLKMSCFTNLTLEKLSPANKDTVRICREGFDFGPDGGMEFVTGVLTNIPSQRPSTALDPDEHSLVFSEVAVGRSLIAEDKDNVAKLPLPGDFHSFYLPIKVLDRNNDGVFDYEEFQLAASFDGRDPSEYHHRYYVKDSAQVLPKYIIQFSFAHRAVPPAASTRAGADSEFEYFDPVLYKPLTMGEYRKTSGRQLQTINEAYVQAKRDYDNERDKPDPLVKGRKDWIEHQLAELERREQQINMNYGVVQEAIDDTKDRCLAELRALSRKKYETLLAVEVELHRQKEQIAWMDIVIKKRLQQTEAKLKTRECNPTDAQIEFLRSWKCHTVFRNAVVRMKAVEMNALQKVVPDMALAGSRDMRVWLDPLAFSAEAGGDASSPAINQSDVWRSLHVATAQGHYLVPPKPKHDMLLPALQGIIDMESERIQHCLEVAKKDASIALPSSVTRSPLAGERYTAPLASLLTVSDPSAYTPLGADPRQRFVGVAKTFVGKLNERVPSMDLSLPWTSVRNLDNAEGEEAAEDDETEKVEQVDPLVPAAAATDTKAAPKKSAVATPFVNPNASSPLDPGVRLSISVLEKIAQRFPAFSMAKQLMSKKQKLANNKTKQAQFVAGMQSLAASDILHEFAPDDAIENIYYSLPSSGIPPVLKCIFNTRNDAGGLPTMVDKCVLVSLIVFPCSFSISIF